MTRLEKKIDKVVEGITDLRVGLAKLDYLPAKVSEHEKEISELKTLLVQTTTELKESRRASDKSAKEIATRRAIVLSLIIGAPGAIVGCLAILQQYLK